MVIPEFVTNKCPKNALCALGLVGIFLSGCASAPVQPLPPEIRYVQVEPPAPPSVNRPDLPVLSLRPGDPPDVVMQAHRESIKLLQQWGLQLEAILDGYRKKDK